MVPSLVRRRCYMRLIYGGIFDRNCKSRVVEKKFSCVERNQIYFVEENLLVKTRSFVFVEFCGNLMSPMQQNHHIPHQVMVMVRLN